MFVINNKRLHLLDAVRGFLMVNAALYHALWDMVYIFGADWPWYRSVFSYIWQQFICCGFIFLSGICWRLAKSTESRAENGIIVSFFGLVITAVTALFMPDEIIIFGILTFIGAAMLLMIPLSALLEKIPPLPGFLAAMALFSIFRDINEGSILYGMVKLPKQLYNGDLMTFIGFTGKGFYSSDYFSLLPWIFLYAAGYFISPLISANKTKLLYAKLPVLDLIGKHSLLFYLFHQPVIYAVLSVFHYFFKF